MCPSARHKGQPAEIVGQGNEILDSSWGAIDSGSLRSRMRVGKFRVGDSLRTGIDGAGITEFELKPRETRRMPLDPGTSFIYRNS